MKYVEVNDCPNKRGHVTTEVVKNMQNTTPSNRRLFGQLPSFCPDEKASSQMTFNIKSVIEGYWL